jgi:serine/threonine protein kinase
MLQNREVVAVKKLLVVPQINLDKQFKNEVFSLIDLNHRNIVKLIGYCYEIHKKLVEYHGGYVFADTQERILCYEYLPRGSLDKYLYGILLYLILSLILVEYWLLLYQTRINSHRQVYLTSCSDTREKYTSAPYV